MPFKLSSLQCVLICHRQTMRNYKGNLVEKKQYYKGTCAFQELMRGISFVYIYRGNIIIIMNDSISSSDDKRRPITLFNEINAINTEDWKHEQFQFSPHGSFHESFDRSRDDNSFANDLPLQSKICHSILQAQDAFQINFSLPIQQKPRSFQEEQKSQERQGSLSSNSNAPSQVTITLHEQSLASKGYEEFQTQEDSDFSTSLKSFLSLNDKNYKPHLTCMKFLFFKLKEHSRQSLENLKLYINFFQIKIKQQTQSLKPFEQIAEEIQKENEVEDEQDELNMDQRVLISQIKKQNLMRRQKRKRFYHQIQEIHEELISLWRKCKEKRQKRERIIQEEIIRVIDRIELQMEDMIKCRLYNEKEKTQVKFSQKIRSQNPYLTKDKYLQMKYLIQRENAYLKLITNFNGKIITYMISMFSKEEVQINREIKEALSDYANAYMGCYQLNNQILNIKISKAEELDSEKNVKLELADKLLTLIPKQLYDINENSYKFKQSNDKLQAILGDFSNYLQNTIFLSTIQMNNEFIIFRNQANWKTSRSFFERQQNCIDYQSKQALANSNSKSTHNTNIPSIHSSNDLRIVVVLTSNYYLHLQNQDKIATVKLGNVKLSKRGREVIISDKGKGFGGYFGVKTQLGRLEFETTQEVDIFAEKLSLALRRLSYS